MQIRYYIDNGIPVSVAITEPQEKVEALLQAIDGAVAIEEAMRMKRCTDDMLDKLIGWDSQWAATPMEDALGLADKLHEVTRDADIEIRAWRRRFRGAILLAAVGWSLLTWIAIAAIWRAL